MHKALEKLCHYSNRAWYGPVIAFLAAADAYVLIVSVEAILFPTVIAHPKKWLKTATWLTVGSAVGAVSFAIVTSIYGEEIVRHFFPKILDSKSWKDTLHLIDHYGFWGLAFVSFSPFPQHAAVAIAGLAHMNAIAVFFGVLIGRALKYIPLAYLATHSPKILRKLHLLPKDLKTPGER